MDLQNVSKLEIPEGEVKAIQDKNGQLLWGRINYNTKYAGDTEQQTYSGKNLFNFGQFYNNRSSITANNGDISISQDSIEYTNPTTSDQYYPAHSANEKSIYGMYNLAPSTTYTISYDATNSTWCYVFFWNSSNTRTQVQQKFSSNRATLTFTTPADISWYSVRIGNTSMETNKISGIQIEAGSTDTPFEKFVGGTQSPNPDYPQEVQTVTGEQTVEVTGKNLFDKNNVNQYMGYYDGNADNPSLVSGVTNRNRVIYIKCKPSTAYSISLTTRDGINNPQVGTTDSLPVTGLAVTKLGNFASGSLKLENLTTSATAQYMVIRFQTQNSTVQFDDISQALLAGLQIEQGSTATAYQPYQSQSYDVNLGKNLWNMNSITVGTNATVTGPDTEGAYTISWTGGFNAVLSPITNINPSLTYAISFEHIGEELVLRRVGSGTSGYLVQTSSDVQYTKYSASVSGYDVLNLEFIRRTGTTNVSASVKNFQLELGSTATSYAPYFTPIELCKIGDYQDYIYKSGEDWWIHKETSKVTLDGTEYWGYSSDTGRERLYHTISDIHLQEFVSSAPVAVMADYFRPSNWYNIYYKAAGDNVISTHNSDHLVIVHSSKFTSANSFKTWLTNNNMTVRYALNTPTEIQITNTTLTSQLDAVHEWLTRYGYDATVSGDLPMIIDKTNL